jgi:hypothetical protein
MVMINKWFANCPNGHQLQLTRVLMRDWISGDLYFKCPACTEQISAKSVLEEGAKSSPY